MILMRRILSGEQKKRDMSGLRASKYNIITHFLENTRVRDKVRWSNLSEGHSPSKEHMERNQSENRKKIQRSTHFLSSA
jgi:hypothetical protein